MPEWRMRSEIAARFAWKRLRWLSHCPIPRVCFDVPGSGRNLSDWRTPPIAITANGL